MVARLNVAGMRFGRLVAIEDAGGTSRGIRLWRCKCDCGKEAVVAVNNLRSGHSKSCGCLSVETTGTLFRVHGLTDTPEHLTWMDMKRRCSDPSRSDFERYGGRGTVVCEQWNASFMSFLSAVGKKPTPLHSIDRIDSRGHYSCGQCDECIRNGWTMNCRWATISQQCRNRRSNRFFEINGETMCLTDWCRKYGVGVGTARYRLSRGQSIEQALRVKA